MKIADLVEEIHNQSVSVGASQDIKYFIAFNSVFSIRIVEEFSKYKELFKTYLENDGENGVKCFIMVMVDFFMNQHPELEIAIPTMLKHVYDAELIEEGILLKWEEKKFKTDKKSCLYSKKSEKKFKKRGEQFFTWLKEADEDESEESEDEDEEKVELTEEEQKAKKMQDLIEKEKQDQENSLLEAKQKQEEELAKIAALNVNNDDEEKIDVLKVGEDEDDDDLDIDNI